MTSSPLPRPSLRRLALAAATVDVVGALVARRRGLVGEPFLIAAPASLPGPILLAGWGTALSGPLLVDVALVALGQGADGGSPTMRRPIRWLGVLRLVGVLSEPATWGRRRPRWTMVLSAAQVVVAGLLIGGGRPSHRPMSEGGR